MQEASPGRARVTIADIARAAGVSKPTVSRALNDHRDVGAATRERVREVAAELGWFPHAGARALRTGRHDTIGLLMPLTHWWGYADIQYGIAEETARRGLHLLVQPLHPGERAEREFVTRTLPALSIDGLILLMPEGTPRHVGALAHTGPPAVVIDDRGHRLDLPYVESTNRAGFRDLVRHLVGTGRKRVAFAGGQLDDAFAQERFEGYQDALREAGLPYDPELTVLPADREPTAEELGELLAAGPDAVAAAWDEIAFGVLNVAHTEGRRVPEDLAVAGFDDSPIARVMRPPLTTVRQPFREMGSAAVRMLLDAIEHGAPPAHFTVPTELVVRASCGAR
ncbi:MULTISPECIES: LacI family DNA-binding transcriptional regulator [Streptomyces]|uniref:LacI family transcriptional regulator n=1 Tax=Streptomyces cacaoi TaxID=1898 RepID=A0A4Y3QTM3_STRCI|nr:MULTISPECIES: LacI family DNA-binding transcriptional regulator [Streptomyces]ATJ33995.1 LacI family transcription regulator [Streptomyces sp.]NNG88821.1 LacI family transcriptional regulator [Streptomyces cacaoi]QHF95767.1 LacI family transcriptional regulator [Streptomyces sp. NHF165]GEB47748.1 LacI family transcriptional regulator [Streptomyces cacaoi]